MIYITTYRQLGQHIGTIEVWDTSDWSSDPNEEVSAEFTYSSDNDDGVLISNLAGLVIGGPYKPPFLGMPVTISDGIDPNDPNENCVSPAAEPNEITYEICYDNYETDPCEPNYLGTLTDMVITVRLAWSVRYKSAEPDDGLYDWDEHSYTWELGHIEPGDSNCLELAVAINDLAQPGGTIEVEVEVETDDNYETTGVQTDVCCWGPDIVYVNAEKTAGQTGTAWYDAYPDLQSALDQAAECDCNEIWIARGTYVPDDDDDDTSAITEGVALYGGFAGDEPNRSDRDYEANKTYLSGDGVGGDGITASDVSGAIILDGLIITFALLIGIATPPMGIGVYIMVEISKVPFEKVTMAVLPLLIPLIIVLLLITFIPPLTLWLPNLVMGPG